MHDGKGEKIRLYEADTPESHQDFGQKAKTFTSDMVFGKTVEVKPADTDRYGWTVGVVYLDGGKCLNDTYDALGRLLTVTRDGILIEEYGYDANGNRVSQTSTVRGISRSLTYSDDNRLLTAGDVSCEHGADRFLTKIIQGASETDYLCSSRGELLRAALPNGRVIEYVYDPLGRRIAKKVDGAITEKYLREGMTRLLAVFDENDQILMRFSYADGRMPLAVTRWDLNYFLFYDQAGSLRMVTDPVGTLVKRVEYDSFRNILSGSSPDFAVPFGFAGGLCDPDTGLVRFGYRDYDPDTGRWTAKDPILFAGGDANLFGYVRNDPINLLDPIGQKTYVVTMSDYGNCYRTLSRPAADLYHPASGLSRLPAFTVIVNRVDAAWCGPYQVSCGTVPQSSTEIFYGAVSCRTFTLVKAPLEMYPMYQKTPVPVASAAFTVAMLTPARLIDTPTSGWVTFVADWYLPHM